MVDIHSATAEIRRGKKKKERKNIEETTGQKYNGLPYSVKRPFFLFLFFLSLGDEIKLLIIT